MITRGSPRHQTTLSPLPSTSKLPYQQIQNQTPRPKYNLTDAITPRTKFLDRLDDSGKSSVAQGKKRAYFIDVVVDGLEIDQDGAYVQPSLLSAFCGYLGAPVNSAAPPVNIPKVDILRALSTAQELITTEQSYLHKITYLRNGYAQPLRDPSHGLLRPSELEQIFSNLDQIVDISTDFVKDLEYNFTILAKSTPVTLEDLADFPPNFGQVVLRNARRMKPFSRWLEGAANRDSTYTKIRNQKSDFADWIDCRQQRFHEEPEVKSLLAEPSQRSMRYGLLLNQIMSYLPPEDENRDALEQARQVLHEFCLAGSQLDRHQAATAWGLQETIEGLPSNFSGQMGSFIACLDVDEHFDSTTLHASLFLFSNGLLVVKRPSDAGKGTAELHAGLDKDTDLVYLHSIALTNSSTPFKKQSSPTKKKLKRNVLKFRNQVELIAVSAIDLGGLEIGIIFDSPPESLSDRWSGRQARRYTIANTYPTEVSRSLAKGNFLPRFDLAKCAYKATKFECVGLKGNTLPGAVGGDSTRMYWSVSQRAGWDKRTIGKESIVLHVDWSGEAADLVFDGATPQLIVRANFEDDLCSLSVRSNDGRKDSDPESKELKEIVPAIVKMCMDEKRFMFPSTSGHLSPNQSPHHTRTSRPLSLLFSGIPDVFSSNTSLSRGHSTGSKMSATSSTSAFTQVSSTSSSTRWNALGRTPSKLSQSSQPAWIANAAASRSAGDLRTSRLDMDLDSDDEEHAVESDSRGRNESLSLTQRNARRRSSLPPPPAPKFDSAPSKAAFLTVVGSPQPSTPLAPVAILSTPSPRRPKLGGPRQMGSAPNQISPLFIPSPSPEPEVSKRPRGGESPRSSPAKKIATVNTGERVPPGHENRSGRRDWSGVKVGRGRRTASHSDLRERASSPEIEHRKSNAALGLTGDEQEKKVRPQLLRGSAWSEDKENFTNHGNTSTGLSGMSRSPGIINLKTSSIMTVDAASPFRAETELRDQVQRLLAQNERLKDNEEMRKKQIASLEEQLTQSESSWRAQNTLLQAECDGLRKTLKDDVRKLYEAYEGEMDDLDAVFSTDGNSAMGQELRAALLDKARTELRQLQDRSTALLHDRL